MTRINLIPPSELMDQHLMAEYRELTMVPAALRRSLRTRTVTSIMKGIPEKFTLNKGHVTFFYNKLSYLNDRYDLLKEELIARGFNLDASRTSGIHNFDAAFCNDYSPTHEDMKIVRARINEKIAQKPTWYRKTARK
jgi:deoxyribonuclease (pyrimidine dimer)